MLVLLFQKSQTEVHGLIRPRNNLRYYAYLSLKMFSLNAFLNISTSYFLPEDALTTSFKSHFKQSGFSCPLTQCCSRRCHHCGSLSSNTVLSQVSSWGLLSASLLPLCLSLPLTCTYLCGCAHTGTHTFVRMRTHAHTE